MPIRKWLLRILILAFVVVAASAGFSRFLRTQAARRYLLAHLVASFGRPVDVGRFDFSLLDGARLEAHSVTVAEDPHFGNEYFLRADTLTAGLRWSAVFAGRFEFGSLTLSRPSLNLTRDAEGHWNIERWLPPASPSGSRPGFVGPLDAPRVARLYRIEVDGGRINFKQLADKSPFALLDVSGQVEQDGAGRWHLDLEARPMRAGVELQDIGTIHLLGTIAGTSARLQPAELHLTWRDASLADALRLARQVDYGMRGELSMDLDAKIGPPETASQSSAAQWSISGIARLTGIHSWGLPERDGDAAANLSVKASWQLGERRAEIQSFLVEMPSSHLQGTGDLDWVHGFNPLFHIETSSVGLNDVLSWFRSFRPDVSEDLRAQGALGVDVTLGGWPIALQQGAIASAGATITGTSLPAPLQIGALNASVARGGLDFAPTEVSFSSAPVEDSTTAAASANDTSSTFQLRGSIFPEDNGTLRLPLNWNLSVEGGTPRVQDWLLLSRELALPANKGWTAAGALSVKMRGTRRTESPVAAWIGTVDLRGLTVSPDRLNQPLRFLRTHIEFTPSQRTITLTAAEALGTSWLGTITRQNSNGQWTFDLSADRLDTADLDRWLGPRARPGFLARFTGLGNTPAPPEQDTTIMQLVARGKLHVGEVLVGAMRLDQLDGDTEIDGRTIRIPRGQAIFFGGKVAGTLETQLVADPVYAFQGHFDRVDLSRLGRSVAFLNNRMNGTASAALSITAHGIGRSNLMASMEGNGTFSARNADLPGVDFSRLFPGGDEDSPGDFPTVQGAFSIHANGIDLSSFVLDDPRGTIQADGRIDFSHALNLRVHTAILQAATSPTAVSPPTFLLTGTIENPKLALLSSAPRPSSRSGNRSK